jgi:hypothetical protein
MLTDKIAVFDEASDLVRGTNWRPMVLFASRFRLCDSS